MHISKEIKKVLKPLKIPVHPCTYIGNEEPYVIFHVYMEKGELFAEDEEITTGYYIHLDLFGKKNLEELSEELKKLMKKEGFIRQSNWDAPYEIDTQLYHKIFRFYKGKDIA